jgi:hypothetical protein
MEAAAWRKLAKDEYAAQDKDAGDQCINYFQRAEHGYEAARELAERLARKSDSRGVFDNAKVDFAVLLGLTFMDQWKFGEAREQFKYALQERKSVRLGPELYEKECFLDPQRFHDRMEYLKLEHRRAMVQCYTDSPRRASENFGRIIEEMTKFLELEATKKGQHPKLQEAVQRLRANSTERHAECLETRLDKLHKLDDALKYQQQLPQTPGYKRVIVMAIDRQQLPAAAMELEKLDRLPEVIGEQVDTVLKRVASVVKKLNEDDRDGAVTDLRNELQHKEIADRESIVTHLLAWQLLRTYSESSEDDKFFTEMFETVESRTGAEYDLEYLHWYREQLESSSKNAGPS